MLILYLKHQGKSRNKQTNVQISILKALTLIIINNLFFSYHHYEQTTYQLTFLLEERSKNSEADAIFSTITVHKFVQQ